MTTALFDLDAGALCLDFANTLEWRYTDHPKEMLGGYSDLIHWGEAAGIMPSGYAQRLHRNATNQPQKAAKAYEAAIKLREAIYRIFANISALEGERKREDLDLLNQSLSESLSHMQIVQSPQGYDWDWTESTERLDRVVWPVTRSAAELLTSDRLDRVGQCADDRGCRYLFFDTSRNGSRRWCSMEACGNRAKARRHYQRQHET